MSAGVSYTPYGRACNQCSRAKAKCSLLPDGLVCERCLRLKKDCQPATGSRRKPGRKPNAPNTVSDQMDDLVSIMESIPDIDSTLSSLLHQSATSHADSPKVGEASARGATPTITMAEDGLPDVSLQEQDASLLAFRTAKVKYFPFVHIPANTSALELRRTRPLLWLSVMASCAQSASMQHALGARLEAEIAELAVVRHQRTIDLLLGVLGFLGWAFYYLRRDPLLVMYSHILAALVQDLRLDHPPRTAPPPPNTSTEAHHFASVRAFSIMLPQPRERTMEERRALLAGYLLVVLVAVFHRSPPALQWTAHMEDCLRVLDQEPETQLDRLLVCQVRLQRVVLDIPTPASYKSISSPEQLRIMREFHVKSLLSRIEDVKGCSPSLGEFREDLANICRLSTTIAEAAIYGIALYSGAPSLSAPDRPRFRPDARRADMLMSCLQLTKQWFTDVFSQPTTTFFSMLSFHTLTQLSHFFFTLYRLSTFTYPDADGWDRGLARAHLDIAGTLDTIAARFAACAEPASAVGYAADRPEGDLYTHSAQTLRVVKASWLEAWRKEEEAVGQGEHMNDVQAAGAQSGVMSVPGASGGHPSDTDTLIPFNGVFPEAPGRSIYAADIAEGLTGGWLSDFFAADWEFSPQAGL